ncbi:hypothetical protein DM02DRAFT_732994 [Periconia macrospinosa]|uniref:Uncharacterized protein n=1 Tax=Periconia macrospinosa TaxID=97972 RepID=A0A2V1D6G1_9PLEO|nr:hypothetical protein DM02DRAFT_732994 [Periconia macrospinosa]
MFIPPVVALLITAATVVAQPGLPPRYRAPGVAFRLTPDYGLASIYLKDGTSVSIAQVRGTPEYEAFMRKPLHSAWKTQSTLCRYLTPAIDYLSLLFGPAIRVCRNPKIESTLGVMHSLKAAVEAYLGTNICFAKLSIDVLEEVKIKIVREALQALGLREVLPIAPTAKFVVYEYKPYMGTPPAYDEDPWIILTIDYSKHWYNVGLMAIDEVGIADPVPGFFKGPTIDKEHQLEAMGRSLRHIIANLPDDVYDLPKQIHQIMIYGDDAKNESLHDLLTTMLGTDLVRNARVSNSIFDGTNFTAYTAHLNMDTFDFPRPPWGCRWRSSLYDEPHHDDIQTEL